MIKRFDATIARQGPNPYVDVPARVSEALADAAVAGRIRVAGTVRGVKFQATLGFMVRVRFAAAVPRQKWLDIAFWLPTRHDDERFHRVETITPMAHIHLVRITQPGQLDDQVTAWLGESYAVGRQEHLR